jgi:hypothetical protein
VRELIIFPGALGDLLCFAPALVELIQCAAGTPVDLMARRELAEFAVGRIGIARAHSIDRPEVGQLFLAQEANCGSARAFFGNFGRIHCFFANGDLQFRRSLAAIVPETHFYPFEPSSEGHIAAAYLRAIGSKTEGLPPARFRLLPSDQQSAMQIIERHALQSREYLLIFPGSGSLRKNWPAENFVRLAQRLTSTIRPLAVIGPAEMSMSALFGSRGVATVSDQELGVIAGLASLSRLFIGNDSGVSHLAAASGARGLVLFGPTDPARWRPLGAITTIQHQPLTGLSVDKVTTRLIRLIQNETISNSSGGHLTCVT